MGDIDIERQHSLGRDEVKRRLAALEGKLRDKYHIEIVWNGDRGEVRGKGVSGSLSVEETTVSVSLKLGMLMRPLAGTIREAMEKQVDRALA